MRGYGRPGDGVRAYRTIVRRMRVIAEKRAARRHQSVFADFRNGFSKLFDEPAIRLVASSGMTRNILSQDFHVIGRLARDHLALFNFTPLRLQWSYREGMAEKPL